jgi:hypothetical protein
MSTTIGKTGTLLAAYLLAGAAFGQAQQVDVTVFDTHRLNEHGMMEAEILSADYDNRTLTVRLEAENETARLIVPEGTEIIETAPNDIERPIELSDLSPGEAIHIEGIEIDGIMRFRIVGMAF